MTTLYSHTFALDAYTGATALPATFNLSGLVTGGATHATVTSVTVMFYKPPQTGTYTMRCSILDPDDVWADYIYEDVEWTGESTQIITFTFPSVLANVSGAKFEVKLAKTAGPPRTTYTAHDAGDTYFVVEGTWEGVLPGDPHTPIPEHEASEVTSFTLSWESGDNTNTFDVYFRAFGEFFEKIASDITDSFISVEGFLYGNRYNYGELYLWCVIAKNDVGENYAPPSDFGIGYGGTIWKFNAMLFHPPQTSYVLLSDDEVGPYDDPPGEEGVDWSWTGGNAMLAVKRLVVAVDNKIWYEIV